MKPKDLLLRSLEEHLVPPLTAAGYRFARSGPRFSRTVGDVRQRIEICSNRYNREDDAELWTMWAVDSTAYGRWYRATWGTTTTWSTLAGSADWNIPGWSRAPAAPRLQLRNVPEDALAMTELRDNILGPGQVWLDRVSTWEGAAEHFLAMRWHFGPAADYLLIAGKPDEARAALRAGIEGFEQQGRPDHFNELPGLHTRLAKYFPSEHA